MLAAACLQIVLSLVLCYAEGSSIGQLDSSVLASSAKVAFSKTPSLPALPINPCRRWDRAHHHVAAVCISKLAVLSSFGICVVIEAFDVKSLRWTSFTSRLRLADSHTSKAGSPESSKVLSRQVAMSYLLRLRQINSIQSVSWTL
jgi:hypothetical protein